VTEARARARARLAAANGLPTRTPAERVEAALGGSSSSSRRVFVGDGAPGKTTPGTTKTPDKRRPFDPPRFTASERRAADLEPTASARLRRAEEELRAAKARAAEASALRRRAAEAERQLAERDERLRAAHAKAREARGIGGAGEGGVARARAGERALDPRALAEGLLASSVAVLEKASSTGEGGLSSF
jgi:hypothetical protein